MSLLSLRDFLRQETRSIHDHLDNLGDRFDLSRGEDYVRFLKAHASVVPSLEAALEEAGVEDWGVNWSERRRSDALMRDLNLLGAAPVRHAIDPIPDQAFGMGCLYVLEGSRLGGAVLWRRVEAGGDSLSMAARNYLGHGRHTRLWSAFVERLNGFVGCRQTGCCKGLNTRSAPSPDRSPTPGRPMSESLTAFVSPGQQVDLTNCDREPIHQLGAIQPVGFLLAVSSDWAVAHASDSTRVYLGRAPVDLIGTALVDLFSGDAIHTLRGRLQAVRHEGVIERVFGIRLRTDGEPFDLALHYAAGPDARLLIIEAMPCGSEDAIDATSALRSMTNRITVKEGFAEFCSEAALQVRALIGVDRVMVYRFAHDGSGEVVAESARPGIDSFLGLHYPASDIPAQARRLYERIGFGSSPISTRPHQ